MPVTVIVGGQYGSEGKGKVAHLWAKRARAAAVLRVGGVNSGHSVRMPDGRLLIFRQLPTSSIMSAVQSFLVPGSYIDLSVLQKEISITGATAANLRIDPKAIVVSDIQKRKESSSVRRSSIGSTGAGVAEALIDRISRTNPTVYAEDVPSLQEYIADTSIELRRLLDANRRILIEGTQGFGLSLLHSNHYPFVTARDTTAAAFVSECGLSPLDVDEIVMVIRSYPIRVSGDSGPLKHELDWNTVSMRSGARESIREFTSVTQTLRRVGEFDSEIVIEAIRRNQPSHIVMNHLDYINPNDREYFLENIESRIGQSIAWVGLSDCDLVSRQAFGAEKSA